MEDKPGKYMLPAHDKRVQLTNNQYVSYALLSQVGSMYLPGLYSKPSVYDIYTSSFLCLQSGCLAVDSQPSVEENSAQGAPVCTVTATDADAPETDNSKITYSLEGTESGRYNGLFGTSLVSECRTLLSSI